MRFALPAVFKIERLAGKRAELVGEFAPHQEEFVSLVVHNPIKDSHAFIGELVKISLRGLASQQRLHGGTQFDSRQVGKGGELPHRFAVAITA